MDITSVNHMSSAIPTSQMAASSQDSHEKNIQNQIVSLQGKMRDLANNNTLSEDEKSDKKKKLKEQIQNLNSELKQYKINKRREGSENNQGKETESAAVSSSETAKTSVDKASTGKTDTEAEAFAKADNKTGEAETTTGSNNSVTSDNNDKAVRIDDNNSIKNTVAQTEPDKEAFTLSDDEAEMMISFSNTMQQFSNMGKIQTQLSGLMRSAETDEEKIEIQGKINSVSEAINAKTDSSARKLSEINDEERKKKERRRRMLEEQQARKENMRATVPKSSKSLLEEIKKDGKVLLTHKKS
ncbi:MAG: FlxA-like family protein [Clostridiales bacterium]|nr:FlxA-like family protein [Clostridiales bacterium]